MATVNKPFIPKRGGGISVTATTTPSLNTIGEGSESLCISSPATNTVVAYLAVGTGTFTATTADYPILPGSQVSVGKFLDHDKISVVTASGAATILIIPGIGV